MNDNVAMLDVWMCWQLLSASEHIIAAFKTGWTKAMRHWIHITLSRFWSRIKTDIIFIILNHRWNPSPSPPTKPSPPSIFLLNCPGDSWTNINQYLPYSSWPLNPTSPPPATHSAPPPPPAALSVGPSVEAAHLASQATGPDAHPALRSLSRNNVWGSGFQTS